MAYDKHLASRINSVLDEKRIRFTSKNMMGGYAVMVDDKMCVGIIKDSLMARVGPDYYEEALSKEHANIMDFTKRGPMKGYVLIEPDGIDMEEDLVFWIDKCLEYNPLAKSSKKKKKKS